VNSGIRYLRLVRFPANEVENLEHCWHTIFIAILLYTQNDICQCLSITHVNNNLGKTHKYKLHKLAAKVMQVFFCQISNITGSEHQLWILYLVCGSTTLFQIFVFHKNSVSRMFSFLKWLMCLMVNDLNVQPYSRYTQSLKHVTADQNSQANVTQWARFNCQPNTV